MDFIKILLTFIIATTSTHYYQPDTLNVLEVIEITEEETSVVRGSGGGGGGGKRLTCNMTNIDVFERINLGVSNDRFFFPAHRLAEDKDGHTVKIIKSMQNPSDILRTEIIDNNLHIFPISVGRAEISVTLENEKGCTITNTFPITIIPDPVLEPIDVPEKFIEVGGKLYGHAEELATDGDYPTRISGIHSGDKSVLEAAIDGNEYFYLIGVSPGRTTVTATVYNPFGTYLDVTFPVTVTGSVYGQ